MIYIYQVIHQTNSSLSNSNIPLFIPNKETGLKILTRKQML